VAGLDLKGLILAGLTIAALGVLDDVTVSQASTVFALHDTDRRLTWRQLVGRAMVVGRDHIASTVNTLFLAYAGASLALLVVFSTGGLPVGEVVNSEIMAGEIIKTVVGSLGIITAVPFTTALAATLAVRRPFDAPPVRGAHLHDHEPPAGAAATTVATVDDADWEDDETLSESERAHRAWVRYLRSEGTDGDEPPASRWTATRTRRPRARGRSLRPPPATRSHAVLEPLSEHDLLLFWAQFTLLLIVARGLGHLFRRVGQPAVVGELGAGLLIGPSVFGRFLPDAAGWLFPGGPTESAPILTVAWIGVALLLIETGLRDRPRPAQAPRPRGGHGVDRQPRRAAAARLRLGWLMPAEAFHGDSASTFTFARSSPWRCRSRRCRWWRASSPSST
jgi:hypothetical protein